MKVLIPRAETEAAVKAWHNGRTEFGTVMFSTIVRELAEAGHETHHPEELAYARKCLTRLGYQSERSDGVWEGAELWLWVGKTAGN